MSDKPARGDLVSPLALRTDHPDGDPAFLAAIRETAAESVQPREPERPFGAVPREVLDEQRASLLSSSPPGRRWREISALDEQVAALDRRAVELGAELAEVAERLQRAPDADADAFAGWELKHRRGPRPTPTLPAIEELAERLKAERAGVDRARMRVLADKEAFVEKHRKRLTKDAEKACSAARRAYEDALANAEQARVELATLRSSALWALMFPALQHEMELPRGLCGDRREPLTRAGFSQAADPAPFSRCCATTPRG